MDTEKKKLTFALVVKYINQPFFNELRTNQQLGYVVHAFEYSLRNIYGLIFMVQSAQHSCEYCIYRANEFLLDERVVVQNLTDSQFKIQRQSLMTDLAETDKNMGEVHARGWHQIAS